MSQALQYLADSVCYQSLYRSGSITFALGRSAVYSVCIADQITQLDAFAER